MTTAILRIEIGTRFLARENGMPLGRSCWNGAELTHRWSRRSPPAEPVAFGAVDAGNTESGAGEIVGESHAAAGA
jgi:hypothetical protein